MCVGDGQCCVCWGSCCPLVNSALNTLVHVGELNDDAEVSVSVLFCVSICAINRVSVLRWSLLL